MNFSKSRWNVPFQRLFEHVEGIVLTRVIAQERAIRFLKGLIEKDRVPHALLFLGVPGTGAVAAALDFVQALHCQGTGHVACGVCSACHKVATRNHPDHGMLFPFASSIKDEAIQVVLDQVWQLPYGYDLPEDHTTITIDRVRQMQNQFARKAFEGKWRTTLILHADHMRAEAANAMLKTLEEPPPQSALILTASNADALLSTIVSRCQVLNFPALSPQAVRDALIVQDNVDDSLADFVARTCGGNFRRAMALAKGNIDDGQDRAFRFLEALLWGSDERTFEALEKLDRQEALEILKHAEVWLRDVLLFQSGLADDMAHVARKQDVERLSGAFDLERLIASMKKIESLREMNHRNVNLRLGMISLWRQMRTV